MSVEDNLLLGCFRRLRLRQARPMDQLATVFALFPRLKERRSQLAGTLSGGERQMLAIGRAMMAKPELLMLDEPSLGLAPRIVKEILQIVSELRTSGISVLLVEQNARACRPPITVTCWNWARSACRANRPGWPAIRR
jgi:branched-chain amino acid transport system ATP-binding protein